MRIHRIAALLFLSYSLLIPSLNSAAEGRVPIFQPTTITESGSYYLSSSFNTQSLPAIVINAPDVSIDLNGLTISTPEGWDGGVIISVAAAVENLTIESGTLRGFDGIQVEGYLKTFTLDGVKIIGDSSQGTAVALIASSSSFEITDCDFFGTVHVNGEGQFERNKVQGSVELGVHASTITENIIRASDPVTLRISGGNNYISHNYLDGADVSESEMELNGNFNIVEKNTYNGSGKGISVGGSGNRIIGNIIGFLDGVPGIQVGGSNNYIADNSISGSLFPCAISFTNANGHVYRNNMLRGLEPPADPTQGPVCGFENTNGGGNFCDTDCCDLTCP